MSEDKKPGLFGRLFGRGKGKKEAEPKADTPESVAADILESVEPRQKPDESDQSVLSPTEVGEVLEAVKTAPADVTVPELEPDAELEPGPPETTPEWIEDHAPEEAPEAPKAIVSPGPVPKPIAAKKPDVAPKKKSWFQRLSSGLKRSSEQIGGGIAAVFTKKKLDQATLDDLEDILIQADFGVDTALTITETLKKDRFDKEISAQDVRAVLATEIERVLTPVAVPFVIDPSKSPYVVLMIGVNGSGKTTTIGKMAQKLSADGKSVMLAAGDTFRAAAIEQLEIWGKRTGAPVISRPAGADASGLAFDAVEAAKAQGSDVLIIDTAGRLQNRDELMAELEKIIRVIKKVDASAPHAVLLTLDATTGQNALNQVDIFSKKAGVTGLVMTKLDGTARGGILVAIASKFKMPVHFIGVGEGVDDLEPFAAKDFAQAIAGSEDI